MTSEFFDRRDLDFLLFELLGVERLTQLPRFAEHSRETFAAVLDNAEKIAGELFAPHNRKADEHEPQFDGASVQLIPEVKQALDAFSAAGFISASCDEEQGGMQLPFSVWMACSAIFKAANISTEAYALLTAGAANLLRTFGTTEQKARYLPSMLAGRWFGTMVLTEPQAGSSLGDITTSARKNADGKYSIRGAKIFISAGDHEITENIVHFVLARIEGAPPGVKGISLFIVPKYRVNADGSRGARNDVALAGLIHKMGFRGTTSTMLNFGERGECVGELIGPAHQGLACMFQMMNEARIGVGLGAAALGVAGYRHSLAYARERPQGRHGKDAGSPQVPIIEHADVRRMLLAQKAYAEGALALCLYAACLSDLHQHAQSASDREDAALLLDLLTPVVKAWPSDFCLEANSLAIQIHGGYGYTREYPVEQIYRDNRLNPIHEGTNGIQALDLLGRKVVAAEGKGLELLGREIATTVASAREHGGELQQHAQVLETAWQQLGETTRVIAASLAADARRGLANAGPYLTTFGHTVVAWLWLRQALVGARHEAGPEADFYRGKLAAARYFFRWELPRAQVAHERLRELDKTWLDVEPQWF
ncbi:MAG TPA: acyl-CoA dehydrogenase [Burkholderiaceae bacterium]|nr:acyl-CoA dehydrogenase [Burkholderiaceae bacterium]